MNKIKAAAVGMAGEFRVMSELLLRGHNPAKFHMDTGIDIILENGFRLQIKSTIGQRRNNWKTPSYRFNLRCGERGKSKLDLFRLDFLICTVPLENLFYIIPVEALGEIWSLAISPSGDSRWEKYKNKWEVLVSNG